MTINCNLRLLLAKVNVERAKQGKPILSLRQLAKETGVSLSVLASLNTRRSRRIDFITLDRLLNYFSSYLKITINDLLEWEKSGQKEAEGQFSQGIKAKEMII
ncbi:MAG TPA: helix-turn-helix transcriptional regulator [Methylomirabilota bacterium]|nr:helix-turn-helix transcriptional regulator [Methylomirabilota bacterium]